MSKKFLGVVTSALLLGVVACSDDSSSGTVVAPSGASESSSSVEVAVPGSSEAVGAVSSSSAGKGSSSSVSGTSSKNEIVGSSSSEAFHECVLPESVSEMWYGPRAANNEEYFVQTGLDNGSETSGYWFSFDDDEANTYVKWPVMQLEYENGVDRVIEVCEGICGTFVYKDEGVLGIGFNVAGEALSGNNGAPAIADISAWGGLCVTYTSETDMDVVMSNDTTFTYIKKMALLPKVSLPKSAEAKTVCSKWSDFVSAVETPSDPTHVASILFVAYGDAGSESEFNVIGVGKYADVKNVCKQSAYPFVSSGKK